METNFAFSNNIIAFGVDFTAVTGEISDLLGNFDYMSIWGPFKTRDEIIGKPIVRIIDAYGNRDVIGEITDCDPTTNEWWGVIWC